MLAIPRDAEHDDDVDALYLAGQLPSDDGEWLLVTELDGLPRAAFTVRHLPRDAWHAHGGDVLVRLANALLCRIQRASVRQDLASTADRDVCWHHRLAPGLGGNLQASYAAPSRRRASATSIESITLSDGGCHGERAQRRRSVPKRLGHR
jgi:hypothetical protein